VNRGARVIGPASEEFMEAVRWYEAQRPGLGAALYDAVNTTIDSIEEQSEIGSVVHHDPQTRRVLVPRFPYQIVYHRHGDEAVIVAIAHLKRRPGYWKHRN